MYCSYFCSPFMTKTCRHFLTMFCIISGFRLLTSVDVPAPLAQGLLVWYKIHVHLLWMMQVEYKTTLSLVGVGEGASTFAGTCESSSQEELCRTCGEEGRNPRNMQAFLTQCLLACARSQQWGCVVNIKAIFRKSFFQLSQ